MTSAADPLGLYDWFKPDDKSPSSYDAGSGTKVAPIGIYEWFTEAMNKSIVAPDGLYPWLDERTQQVKQDWSNWSTVVAMPTEIMQRFYQWFVEIAKTAWEEFKRIAGLLTGAAGGLVGGGAVENMTSSESFILMKKMGESFQPRAYDRPEGGGKVIGYGHNIVLPKDAKYLNAVLSEAQADALLREDVRVREADIKKRIRVPLSQARFDCCVAAFYGMGSDAQSDFVKAVNSGSDAEVLRVLAYYVGWDPKSLDEQGKKLPFMGLILWHSVVMAVWMGLADWPKGYTEKEIAGRKYLYLWKQNQTRNQYPKSWGKYVS
ncbi:glycoside hydrolase family protein [Chitinilyticum aquatile]|uniref:glycoside hydrolase family protein n=1 Tax=Chitinilyticum aquatile TaxID=362520 RepID=UPI00040125D2|nr:glycoside hydrolase family protein [Chitinilyticum aquatile]